MLRKCTETACDLDCVPVGVWFPFILKLIICLICLVFCLPVFFKLRYSWCTILNNFQVDNFLKLYSICTFIKYQLCSRYLPVPAFNPAPQFGRGRRLCSCLPAGAFIPAPKWWVAWQGLASPSFRAFRPCLTLQVTRTQPCSQGWPLGPEALRPSGTPLGPGSVAPRETNLSDADRDPPHWGGGHTLPPGSGAAPSWVSGRFLARMATWL